jgi:hypothetical protein
VWHPWAALARIGIDAVLFYFGYALASSLLTSGPNKLYVVSPGIFPGGTFNARVVVVVSMAAGLLAVVAWRSAYYLRRRQQ